MKKGFVLSKQRETNGYTLIEILIVATIIGLLAAATSITYSQISKQSRDAKRKTDLEQIRAAVEMYRSNNNGYPASISPGGSICDPSGCPPSGNKYLNKVPTDPKTPTYTYYYLGSTSNYTLGAYLEVGGTNCQAGCGAICNYCLDAYGQK